MLTVLNYCQEKMRDLWGAKAKKALIEAVRASDVLGVRRALEAGADVNASYPDEPGSPLMHIAAKRNDVKTMKLLVDAGASVNVTNAKRQSPLHVASLEAMEWLLQSGAIVDAVDLDSYTPLTANLAIARDDVYLKLLLRHGADPNAQVSMRLRGGGCQNVLEFAIVVCPSRALATCVTGLLEAGAFADIDRLRDDSYKTTLRVYAIGMNVLGRLRYGRREYWFVREHLEAPLSLKLTAACAVRAGLRRGAGGRSILQPSLALPLPPTLIRYVSLSGSESRLDIQSDT